MADIHEDGDDRPCLHCYINTALEQWLEDTGGTAKERDEGESQEIVRHFGAVLGQFMAAIQPLDQDTIRQFLNDMSMATIKGFNAFQRAAAQAAGAATTDLDAPSNTIPEPASKAKH